MTSNQNSKDKTDKTDTKEQTKHHYIRDDLFEEFTFTPSPQEDMTIVTNKKIKYIQEEWSDDE